MLSPTETGSGACTANSRLSRCGAIVAAWPEASGAVNVRRVLQRRPAWASTASDAAPADLQALLRQQRLHAARTIGATPLHKIALYGLLHVLSGCSVRAWRAATPLVVAAPRHCQDPTDTPDGTRCGRRLPPGVRHGSCGATVRRGLFSAIALRLSAGVVFPQARQRLVQVFVLDLLRLLASPGGMSRSRGGAYFHCTPRSRAVWAIDCSDSTASVTARSLNAAGYACIAELTHRTPLSRFTNALVSVCPEEYSHFTYLPPNKAPQGRV